MEIHLFRGIKYDSWSTFACSHWPDLFDKLQDLLAGRDMSESSFSICIMTHLDDKLLKSLKSQVLKVILSFHRFIYFLDYHQGLLFFDLIKLVILCHFPYLGNIDLLLTCLFVGFYSINSGMLVEKKPPNLSIFLHEHIHIINVLSLFFIL